LVTLLGASIVFFFKKVNKNLMDAMLGFAAGVMISASFWSLLSPAITMAKTLNMIPWLITSIGFFSGGLLLFIGDKVFDNIYKNENNKLKRILMLIFSITLHNIPEGLAVGVAFGSVIYGLDGATLEGACVLALGIGLQNFPEGTAVSVPLHREGYSLKKSFFIGQLTGIVEPIAGVIGALLVLKARVLLPFLLSFAAGAMIYVVVEELIPESQTNQKKDLMAFFTLIGFLIMMILDISLG
jgi:ZIP family zinc transporter